MTDSDRLLALVDELVRELRPESKGSAGLDSALDRDLGLDSLARVELLSRVERAFSVRLPEGLLEQAETPRTILDALHGAGHGDTRPDRHPRSEPLAPAGGLPEQASTLLDVLDWHVTQHPHRRHASFSVSDEQVETMSYAELREQSATLAGGLVSLGVRPGQCVALMLPSGLDFFRSFIGILQAGAIPVPMYPPARPNQIEDHLRRQAGILQNCEAAVLITFDAVKPLAHLLAGLAPNLRSITTVATLKRDSDGSRTVSTSLPTLRRSTNDLALLQYTSGSTGAPKGVMLTHHNLLANIRAWGAATHLGPSDVCVSWLPLYHDMGLIGAWLGSLYHGCLLVLMSPLDFLVRPERWLWAIHTHRGTVTAAPNFAFDLCVRRLADAPLEGLDLSSWRLAANGAEPVSAVSLERFAATFARYGFDRGALAPVYGLAECTVGLAVPPPGRGVVNDAVEREAFMREGRANPVAQDHPAALHFVSCGPPLPGHEIRIVNERGEELPDRHVGHLQFRGPSTTGGYYRNREATAALFHGDWLDSGDYAYLANGEVHITGRSKDLIIRGGRNFYPYELEQAIGDLPGIRKGCVAVFGVRDAELGTERLVVVAETRERDPRRREELERNVVALAADLLGLPPDVVVLAPLHAVLKTSSGKIRRSAIRDAWLDGSLAAPGRAPWRQALGLALSSATGLTRQGFANLTAWSYGAWAWTCFGALAGVAISALTLVPGAHRRWTCVHLLARLFARLTGCPIETAGREHLPHGPYVIVANHASYVDGFVLAAAFAQPLRFVAKAEFRKHPLIDRLFRRLGFRYVERFDSTQGVEDAQQLAGIVHDGPPLLFFAEGTFGPQPGVLPFRLGAFQVAARNGLPVVPVALAGTRTVLRDGSWLPRRGRIQVRILPPVLAGGDDWHSIVALRDAARSAIAEHAGEPLQEFAGPPRREPGLPD